MFTPFKARGVTLQNRIVVSPMAMYSAIDGLHDDFHLVHLGSRALGGAGLIFAEMTCVSPDARITPGCLGLWNDAQDGGLEADRRFHSCELGRQGRDPARSCGAEGVDQGRLGGHRPAARRRRLAA